MRILGLICHSLLFAIVSWTVYNTFLFICLILPDSDNNFVELTIFDCWNFYLLGALDFHGLIKHISEVFHGWQEPRVLHDLWPFLIYVFVVNGMAAFIWLRNQNPFSAAILALAPCIAGPYLALVFRDYRLLFLGIIGIIVFYGILYKLNGYRKKYWPQLSLPSWLEWRRSNMVPSLKSIAQRIAHMIRKPSS